MHGQNFSMQKSGRFWDFGFQVETLENQRWMKLWFKTFYRVFLYKTLWCIAWYQKLPSIDSSSFFLNLCYIFEFIFEACRTCISRNCITGVILITVLLSNKVLLYCDVYDNITTTRAPSSVQSENPIFGFQTKPDRPNDSQFSSSTRFSKCLVRNFLIHKNYLEMSHHV